MPVTFLAIQRVLGYLVMIFSFTMLTPIFISVIFNDGTWIYFAISFFIILGSGATIWFPVRTEERELHSPSKKVAADPAHGFARQVLIGTGAGDTRNRRQASDGGVVQRPPER